MAIRRTKEVSIRKVFGASVNQIALLISKEFLIIVLIANVLALPIAYFVMEEWLSGFAYRINPGVMAFLFPAICTGMVALITISFQSIKVAVVNPVDSLRKE